MKKIAIIGAGSWGTALSIVLSRSRAQHALALWALEPDVLASLRARRTNDVFLPGFEVPREVQVTGDLGAALAGAAMVVSVIPSAHVREMLVRMLPHLTPEMAVVSATKGLEPSTHERMSEVFERENAAKFPLRVAVLSGPSFAREVARGDPTAVVIASKARDLAAEIREEFAGPTFRLYSHDDVIGVELGGAVKNVIAIAAGVCEGLGFGSSTIAALITRGLAEMTRLAVALGGRAETLGGLAGMGDLVLTCTGALSRNRQVGVELGKGRKLAEIVGAMRMVAEGVGTTAATVELAERSGVEMPITRQMHAVLNEGRSPRDAIRELMERPLREE
jgi:glycerol-3-phosphate dehydrogenase (NAD(P)+)